MLYLFTAPGTTSGYDNGWDGHKFLAPGVAQLYAVAPDGNLQVSTNADISGTLIGFQPGENSAYVIRFKPQNTEDTYTKLYLQDLKTKSVTEITSEAEYHFTASPTDKANRFRVLSYIPGADDDPDNVNIRSAGKMVHFHNLNNIETEIRITNVTGTTVYQETVSNSASHSITLTDIKPGIYIAIAVRQGKQPVSKKIMVK